MCLKYNLKVVENDSISPRGVFERLRQLGKMKLMMIYCSLMFHDGEFAVHFFGIKKDYPPKKITALFSLVCHLPVEVVQVVKHPKCHLSSDQNPGCLLQMEDDTTQLY